MTCTSVGHCKFLFIASLNEVLFQPLGVFFEKGCDYHLAICILLTILGYIPGIIYACYVILAY
ncbi:unnamed protein product [Haemonchus placei]|uniref:Uncharacterized protein n=1 Tax=Haemonchus placei TaxID=6290 RepID=A0A3P7X105_HAEPC|nr:unnamed protein product [Haemonchus placei]